MVLKGILFLSIIFFIYRNKKKYNRNIAVLFFMAYFIVIMAIKTFFDIKVFYNSISLGFYCYYYMFPCLFSLVVCDLLENRKYRYNFFILLIGISISNIFANNYDYFKYKKDTEFNEIINYLQKKNIVEIVTSFKYSGKVWSYSDGKIRVGHWYGYDVMDDINPIYWLGHTDVYGFKDKPTYVIIDDAQEKVMLDNVNSKIYRDKGKKIFETLHYKLYEFETNPLAELRMPRKAEILTFPINKVTLISPDNGYTNNGNSIISKGKDGFIFFGPYIYVHNGTYNIEFEYKDFSNIINETVQIGRVEVVSHDENDKDMTVILSGENIISGNSNNKVVLKNVKFDKSKNVEFRAYGFAGYEFEISKIIITRIK